MLILATVSAAETAASAVYDVKPWAKPLRGGPIRVGFIVPVGGSFDVSLLARRLDLETEVVEYGANDNDKRPDFSPLFQKKLDAMVIANGVLDAPGVPSRDEIKEMLGRGTGVLFVRDGAVSDTSETEWLDSLGYAKVDHDFFSGIGIEFLTDIKPGFDQAAAYEGPKGRVAVVTYWAERPPGHALLPAAPSDALNAPTTLENYLSFFARALRWVAHRAPNEQIVDISSTAPEGPAPVDTPPQLPRKFVQRLRDANQTPIVHSYLLSLSAPATRRYALRVTGRYPYRGGEWSFIAEEKIEKGERRVTLSIPGNLGPQFLDVSLLAGDKIVDWYTQATNVPGWPEIESARFSSQVVNANDRLRIELRVAPHLSRPRPFTVLAQASDPLGRVAAFSVHAMPREGGHLDIELPLVDLVAPYLDVNVFVSPSTVVPLNWWTRERSAHTAEHVLVRQPLPGGFLAIADAPGDGTFHGRARRQSLANLGIGVVSGGPDAALGTIAADGLLALGDLGILDRIPDSAELGPRTPAGYQLRESAKRYRYSSGGLYVHFVDMHAIADTAEHPSEESTRERLRRYVSEAAAVLREHDSTARLALVPVDATPPQYGSLASIGAGFRIVPLATDDRRYALNRVDDEIIVLRAMPDSTVATPTYLDWLPWHALINDFDGVWLANANLFQRSLENPNRNTPYLERFQQALSRVRTGYDILLRAAKVSGEASKSDAVTIDDDFDGQWIVARFGAAEIVLALRAPQGRKKGGHVSMTADEGWTAYAPMHEPGAGKKRVTVAVGPGRPIVLTRLPYEVTRVAVKLPAIAERGRRLSITAQVKTRGNLPDDHVVHIRLIDPDGAPIPHYDRALEAKLGHVDTYIPLAFNEMPGEYTVEVHDIVTGASGSGTVMVQ